MLQTKSWQSLYAFVQLRCEFDVVAVTTTIPKRNGNAMKFISLAWLVGAIWSTVTDFDGSTSRFMWAHMNSIHSLNLFPSILFSISNTIPIRKSLNIRLLSVCFYAFAFRQIVSFIFVMIFMRDHFVTIVEMSSKNNSYHNNMYVNQWYHIICWAFRICCLSVVAYN